MHFGIPQLNKMRPNWAQLDDAEFVIFPKGESARIETRDATQYFLVLEGALELATGQTVTRGEPGELLLVAPGQEYRLGPALEDTVVLRLAEQPCAPFRYGAVATGTQPTIPLTPAVPLRSPMRRGVALMLDSDATFSPAVLRNSDGSDVLLTANPGALSASQAREFRSHCRKNKQAVVALRMDLEDAEIRRYFYERMMVEHTLTLAPRALCIEADLATMEGRRRAELMLFEWRVHAHPENLHLTVAMPQRRWTDAELCDLFRFLAAKAPAHLGIILDWEPAEFAGDFRSRAVLAGLLPWLHAVNYLSPEGAEQTAHYLAGMGFQGWLIQPA